VRTISDPAEILGTLTTGQAQISETFEGDRCGFTVYVTDENIELRRTTPASATTGARSGESSNSNQLGWTISFLYNKRQIIFLSSVVGLGLVLSISRFVVVESRNDLPVRQPWSLLAGGLLLTGLLLA
jgi:hypothetical protein